MFGSITPYEKTTQRHKAITDAITNYLAKDMVPIYTVQKEVFCKMVRTLDRRYELPGGNFFNDTAIPQLYGKRRREVQAEFAQFINVLFWIKKTVLLCCTLLFVYSKFGYFENYYTIKILSNPSLRFPWFFPVITKQVCRLMTQLFFIKSQAQSQLQYCPPNRQSHLFPKSCSTNSNLHCQASTFLTPDPW